MTAGKKTTVELSRVGPAKYRVVAIRAAWVDPELGLFRVLDRDRTAIRLGPVSVDFVDLRRVVAAALQDRHIGALQAVVSRHGRKDTLTLVIAYRPETDDESLKLRAAIVQRLGAARPMFKDHVDSSIINPMQIKFLSLQELPVNPRTGKVVEVLDLRSTVI